MFGISKKCTDIINRRDYPAILNLICRETRVVDLKLELCEQVFFPRYKKVTATFYDKRFSEEIMLEFYVNQVEIYFAVFKIKF